MAQKSFWKFLISAKAVYTHLLFGIIIFMLSIDLWNGNQDLELWLVMLFALGAYPARIWLDWTDHKKQVEQEIADSIEATIAPDKFRANKQSERNFMQVLITIVAITLVYFGEQGLVISGIPAEFLGYLFLGFVGLALAGVNVWIWGPLDLRKDPPPTISEE